MLRKHGDQKLGHGQMSTGEDAYLRLSRPAIGYDALRDAIIDAGESFNAGDISIRIADGELEVVAAQLRAWAKRGNASALLFCRSADQAAYILSTVFDNVDGRDVDVTMVGMAFLNDTHRIATERYAQVP